ncbi:MAG: hypothetical protein N2Z79_04030, partial [Candidatus Omnitrophica bacterium]|nr:hypothetical protein [Candidatus Omnitrophota bacterium]
VLVLTDIYSAGETPLEGISVHSLYEEIKRRESAKKVIFLEKTKIADFILDIALKGDLIITLGAGDITYLSDELAQRIKNPHQTTSAHKRIYHF